MSDFWLATFRLDAPKTSPVESPILASANGRLAIEVLRNGDVWGVLFSAVDDLYTPVRLRCLIGFTNSPAACNLWHDRGFPLIDAEIGLDLAGALRVATPCFRDTSAMEYDRELVTLSGIDFLTTSPGHPPTAGGSLPTHYVQERQAPDVAQPDLLISRQEVTWVAPRTAVEQWPAKALPEIVLDLGVPAARLPSLAPFTSDPRSPEAAWTGKIDLTGLQPHVGRVLSSMNTAETFGLPAFRFEDVEVVGFRIDLTEYGPDVQRQLAELIAPLNFHLASMPVQPGRSAGDPIPDYSYRVATRTLVIELLRYGRMKSRAPAPPMRLDDAQGQHELVVRLLVGRVDDDSTQARAPAVYVPAIFVDNPWSKVLGRDRLGFDKQLAEFCIRQADQSLARLFPDGRVAASPGAAQVNRESQALGSIAQVRLVDPAGAPQGPRSLFEVEYEPDPPTDPDALRGIDLDLTFGTSLLAGVRWRQSDFAESEFRRSFARLAIVESVRRFRSVQVAPLADNGLGQTWVEGTFAIDPDVRFALPSGKAHLTLHAAVPDQPPTGAPSASDAWNRLCAMLGDGKTAEITIGTGSWYRLRCSMDLTIDDGLSWDGLDL